MTRIVSRLVVAHLTLLLSPLIARSALTTYNTRAAWEAAVGSFTTETFDSTPLQLIPNSGGTIDLPAFDIVIDANHGGVGIATAGAFGNIRIFNGDVHGVSTSPPHFNRFVFDAPIRAFAANLFAVNEGGIEAHLAGDVEIVPDNSAFFGVTSDVPFDTVELRKSGAQGEFYSMDNVSFAAIPEPAAVAMALAGLVFAPFGARRFS